MHVSLIAPPTVVSPSHRYVAPVGSPPLGLAYIARMVVESGHDLTAIDAVGERIEQFSYIEGENIYLKGLTFSEIVERVPPQTHVIGLSAMFTSDWRYIRHLVPLLRARAPNALIVLGGEHATADAENIVRFEADIDLCILGEGDDAFAELLQILEMGGDPRLTPGSVSYDANGVHQQPRLPRKKNIDQIRPYWDQFPVEEYLSRKISYNGSGFRAMPMLATRGCPYACSFCSNPGMWGINYALRSPTAIVEEMRWLRDTYKIEVAEFFDLAMTIKRSWVLEFCKALQASNLGLSWRMPSGTRSEILDVEVLTALRAAGLAEICYAPDTGSPSVMQRIGKKANLENILTSIAFARSFGFKIRSHVIIGFPDETPFETLQTVFYCFRMAWKGSNYISVYVFSPYFGTELSEKISPKDSVGSYQDYVNRLGSVEYDSYTKVIQWKKLVSEFTSLIYVFIGNLTMILCFFMTLLRSPGAIPKSIKNILSNKPQGPYETALSSLFRSTA